MEVFTDKAESIEVKVVKSDPNDIMASLRQARFDADERASRPVRGPKTLTEKAHDSVTNAKRAGIKSVIINSVNTD